MKRAHNRIARGSALLLALWSLLLLSAAVFAWVKVVDQDIAIAGAANDGLDARALAHSGVNVALHPLVGMQTPILNRQFTPTRSYQVELQGEGGKMNINWLLQGALNDSPAPGASEKLIMLRRYFERLELTFQEREALIDSMLDWIDPDNLARINGAEEDGVYRPPNRGSFLNLDEIGQVKNSRPLTSKPGWKDEFTVYSNPGQIDLQSASLAVLQVLPNVGDDRAASFLQLRQGPDKIDGTSDDRIFKDLNEALSYLGMGGPAGELLVPFVSLNDPTRRIVSVGHSGKVYRQVEVVARKVGAQPQILWWKE